MIGLILADPTGGAVYDVGYFGLGRLTGVDYDESHDGQWWLNWWHANQNRLPAHVRGLPIPDYRSNR